jgi:uncharacterized protein YjbI with pentapeptide repeats
MKTKFEIKHSVSGDVLFSFECESIKECVIEAVKQKANLTGANLTWANLTGANLTGADLDMSSFPLRCSSLTIKTNKRLRVQLAFHFLSLIKHGIEVTDEEKKIFEDLKAYANQFHRTDVERL